jgi:hypothetical protein
VDGVAPGPAATVDQTTDQEKEIAVSKNQGVDRTKNFREKSHGFARGGDQHMFDKQAASTKKPGITGKIDERGPGKKVSRGGRWHAGQAE